MRRRKYPWKQADILIHRYCRRLTTGQRLAVIAVAFALFMAGCLYMIPVSYTHLTLPTKRIV